MTNSTNQFNTQNESPISIGVKNFRSLKNTKILENEMVELKHFNLLLGKNSCGKSSFLRLFPLLKQSASSRTRGALAFFGDEVDFGDFETVISKEKGCPAADYIEYSFTGYIRLRENFFYFPLDDNDDPRYSSNQDEKFSINIQIRNDGKKAFAYISKFTLIVFQSTFVFEVNSKSKIEKFTINGQSFFENEKMNVVYTPQRPSFPSFDESRESNFWTPLINYFFGKTHTKEVFRELRIFKRWPIDNLENTLKYFAIDSNFAKYDVNQTILNRMAGAREDLEEFKHFYNNLLLFRFSDIYDAITFELIKTYSSIAYSKPLRANADRYYRSRTLAVNEVNSDGSNLVEFYTNLGDKNQQELNVWMKKNFDFHYTIEKTEGHQSIYICENDGSRYNITDMGFGFSQILPIATQLWTLFRKGTGQNRSRVFIYAIEQPELHLHPALQCKFVNAISKIPVIANQKGLFIAFVIETHSETIVNQFGRLIRRCVLKHEDISVLVFSKDKTPYTSIQSTPFDSEGILTEWPIGFFGED